MKNLLKHAGRALAGMVPAAVLVRIGMTALATLVFLAVLVLGVICWIIDSDDRTGRVNRILLARQGNAKCLEPSPSVISLPASWPRRRRPRRPRQRSQPRTSCDS